MPRTATSPSAGPAVAGGARARVEAALSPGQDPRTHARRLRQVREAVLHGGTPPAPPRPVIGASWRRLRWTGLDPSGLPEVPLLGAGDLERRRASSGLEPLLPLLRSGLLPTAEAAGQVMVVVDADGRVLWREGRAAVCRRADALGFVEGSAWDEPSVGTNAIGTSLVVGGPVHVFAGEHWAESHQPWTCAAAPLHDPLTGRLLGAVDLSGPAATVHPSTVALVAAVARLAELEVRAAHEQRLERLRGVAAPLLARLPGPALVVSLDGTPAAVSGLPVPDRLLLPEALRPGTAWVPTLGRCTAEALPGGWLLRLDPDGDAEDAVVLVLDLAGSAPSAVVHGPSGGWSHPLGVRHAEILLSLAQHPQGRSAAELADDLFGDASRTVTVRAELSRLRRALGPLLDSQPYRIADGVQVQLRLPEDPSRLLPASTAPSVLASRASSGSS